jgi:hypothetical protein
MDRSNFFDRGRESRDALLQQSAMVVDLFYLLAKALLWLVLLPLTLFRLLVATGLWIVDFAMKCVLALLALLLIAQLVFGTVCVLAYPLLQ